MDPLMITSMMTKGLDTIGEMVNLRGQAQALDLNAGLTDLTAQGVISSGDYSARRMAEQGKRFVATQRARYAASGVSLEGSPLNVIADTERNISLDIMATKLNAAAQANELGFKALQQRIAAGQLRTRSIQALSRGLLDIGGSVATSQYGKK